MKDDDSVPHHPEPDPDSSRTLLSTWKAYRSWSEGLLPSHDPENHLILQVVKYMASMNAANYQMSNKQKLMLIMLVDGEHWRAHSRQAFMYSNGAWVMTTGLKIEAWEIFLAVEGLLLATAKHFEDGGGNKPDWSWSSIADFVTSLMNSHRHDAVAFFGREAKQQSDHLRQTTGNKTWKALWLRRVADMLATFRCQWDSSKVQALSKLFLQEWDSPLPKSRGVCFQDVYLDVDWNIAAKSPANDCYMPLDYPFNMNSLKQKFPGIDVKEHRERLRLFIESLYFSNQHVFQLKLCFLHAAFKKVCTSKMIFEIGKGGDGKGMEAYLEKALFSSDQSATLDCGVFLDRQEFRKSAEFAWNKANVRVQEMDQHARFIADLWKRFVVDEEIDCRVNYGFTSKRRFGTSMKVQELNYENVPVIEEGRDKLKGCEQLKRRIMCFRMGKARFVTDPCEVDHEKGVFQLIPQDELVPFLSHPMTCSIFFREWCLPFFKENTIEECLAMILNPGTVDPAVVEDTDWLATRLSGGNAPPPGSDIEMQEDHDNLIIMVHSKTPMKMCVKEYLLQRLDVIPGAISSSRGRRTKVQNFASALDQAQVRLFRQQDHSAFEKLQVHWTKLHAAMEGNGGTSVFGGWPDWHDTFDLRQVQQDWDGQPFFEMQNEFQGNMQHRSCVSNQLRPTIAVLPESVHLQNLRTYVDAGIDRRLTQLQAYLQRHLQEGSMDGLFSTIQVEYYKAPNYGRLLARGPAAQKMTREARAHCFPHLLEVDASCCHPRLLLRLLNKMNLDNQGDFTMLTRFCQHFKAWRSALASYLEITLDEAKTHLIRIFYGGNPTQDIPWLRKLGHEVQTAASLILKHPSFGYLNDLYADRRNGEFSRLCSLLSFDEAALLDKIRLDPKVRMEVAIFDGGLVSAKSLEDIVHLQKACQTASQDMIEISIKVQQSTSENVLAALIMNNEVSFVDVDVGQVSAENCFIHALTSVEPACDISGLLSQLSTYPAAGLCAQDFNSASTDGQSQSDHSRFHLRLLSIADLHNQSLLLSVLCHEATSQPLGHWWSFKSEGADVTIYDMEAGPVAMMTSLQTFIRKVDQLGDVTFFQLVPGAPAEDMPNDPAYFLYGRGRKHDHANACDVIKTPLKKCMNCGAPLCPRHPSVGATLYTLSGPQKVEHLAFRCTNKSTCRMIHFYNFAWNDGRKINSLMPDEQEYVFITANTGFCVKFLRYHDALQFRGFVSNRAVAWAQKDVLWLDDHEHARFYKDYGHASASLQLICFPHNMILLL